MADYYPLLSKAVAGLPDPTADARQAVYERARRALFGQLRTLDPPVPEDVIDREAQALERAVAQLETEITARFGPDNGVPFTETEFTGLGPQAAIPPGNGPRTAPLTFQATRVPRRPPPLKARREMAAGSPAAMPPPPPAPGTPPPVPPAPKPSSAGWDKLQNAAAALAPSGQADSRGPGFQPMAPHASLPEYSGFETPVYETFGEGAASPDPEDSYETAARTRIDAHRPFAPLPEEATSAAKRFGIVAAIVGLVVVAVAIAAYKLRDHPEDLVRLQPPPSTVGEAGAGAKIIDRIESGGATPGTPAASAAGPPTTAGRNDAGTSGPEPAPPAIPVARRAALLIEAPEEQSKVKTMLGTVVWRVENVSNGPDEPISMAVRAEVEIPDAGLQAAMIIQKNLDTTLPASHTMKLRFTTQPNSPLANIRQISVLQMRREDTPTGDPLKGITVPVTENTFLIGLSRGDGEATNLDLLRSRDWFDIPMILANGHIAKLTFEKGPSGRSALEDAMASWQAQP